MKQYEIPSYAVYVCETLRKAGYDAHLVGGCVRDLMLGAVPHDWDVCSSALPEQATALFDHVIPTGIQHGTVTVVLPEANVEVTTYRIDGTYSDGRHPDSVTFGTNIEGDLARRDFTVNAMALNPDGSVIDPFGGLEDLRAGIIRCVRDPYQRFQEDALRILRGVRFAAKLGFSIDPATWDAMAACAPLADRVSTERITAELDKTLLSAAPHMVRDMVRLGVLDRFYAAPRDVDYDSLDSVPLDQYKRWRAFCRLTGFPVRTLTVSRALRQAVEHPERALMHSLALSGTDIIAMGYSGPAVGQIQSALALHVLDHPEDNTVPGLQALLEQLQASGTIPALKG